ncbi:hypothetical protein CEXT_249041 [Caerostris extrusa]|uniref:Uncharacterized protein n=1 Tax=Caerostris extrusa TaxID=172846 RepID=A0AAV4SEJ4_CAEEX|nr:hypothetical protein CEXT_249041 [Caerostris extrusa]
MQCQKFGRFTFSTLPGDLQIEINRLSCRSTHKSSPETAMGNREGQTNISDDALTTEWIVSVVEELKYLVVVSCIELLVINMYA